MILDFGEFDGVTCHDVIFGLEQESLFQSNLAL